VPDRDPKRFVDQLGPADELRPHCLERRPDFQRLAFVVLRNRYRNRRNERIAVASIEDPPAKANELSTCPAKYRSDLRCRCAESYRQVAHIQPFPSCVAQRECPARFDRGM
jgi:hypothetical protein